MPGGEARTAGAIAAAALLLLVGCGAPGDQPGDQAPADETAAATAPAPLIDRGCEDLLDRAVVDEVLSPAAELVPTEIWGGGAYVALATIGAAQAGALSCEWLSGEGVEERRIQVAVLPDAAESWALIGARGSLMTIQTTPDRFGDASWDGCLSACYADALVGDFWLGTIVTGPQTNLDRVTGAIVDALRSASTLEASWSTDSTAPADCEAALQLATLRGVLGAEVDPWSKDDPTRMVHHAGFLQAGGLFCAWRNSFDAAGAMTAEVAILPGGGWAWQDYLSTGLQGGYTREAVDGLGDAAWVACRPDGDCAVGVQVGDTWIDVMVNDELGADDRAKAVELATAVMTTLNG